MSQWLRQWPSVQYTTSPSPSGRRYSTSRGSSSGHSRLGEAAGGSGPARLEQRDDVAVVLHQVELLVVARVERLDAGDERVVVGTR